jgi:hypothetical protein
LPKPDQIFDLELRQQVLEDEIARDLSHWPSDDPMVADIKRRMLHLKEELERFCNKAIADRRLHQNIFVQNAYRHPPN